MKPKQCGPLPPEEEKRTEIALFRYGLIAPLLHHPLQRGEIIAHLKACAAKTHDIPHSKRTSIAADTIWRYLVRYRRGGFEALKPHCRADADKPRRIPEHVIQKAIALREEVPSRSAKMIVDILRRDPDVPPDLRLVPHTLSCILNKRGKSRERLAQEGKGFRRFEREQANALWQGDMLIGPYLPDVERPGKYRRPSAEGPFSVSSTTTLG
ncbi:MAG: hypothetical protein ACUVX1_17925 [Chloroflexota bacterium]